MRSRFLQDDNCPTYHAESDADVLIVKTTVESARKRNTVLVGNDTDCIHLYCCASTPVQIASTFISSQKHRQTPEDEFRT